MRAYREELFGPVAVLYPVIKSAPDLSFGGVKSSGIGRELGRFGLDEFANKKLVREPGT